MTSWQYPIKHHNHHKSIKINKPITSYNKSWLVLKMPGEGWLPAIASWHGHPMGKGRVAGTEGSPGGQVATWQVAKTRGCFAQCFPWTLCQVRRPNSVRAQLATSTRIWMIFGWLLYFFQTNPNSSLTEDWCVCFSGMLKKHQFDHL